MKSQLKEIAAVRQGIPFREAVRHEEDGLFAVVQAGDVGADGTIDLSTLLRIRQVPTKGELPILGEGEVLLQSRGQSYRAAVVPPHEMPLVATASVFVLSPRAIVNPDYLAHFLNDPVTQAELRKQATGATIPNLRRSVVEHLDVLLPLLKDQKRIVALGETLRRQSEVEARIHELRRIELRALLEERAGKNQGR